MSLLGQWFYQISMSFTRQTQHESHRYTLAVLHHLRLPAEQVPHRAATVVAVVDLIDVEKCPWVSKEELLSQSVVSIDKFSPFHQHVFPQTVSFITNILTNVFASFHPR